MDKPIIVAMTSWTARINDVVKTIDSLLNQTIKPSRIELNLATPEFPKGFSELPTPLQDRIAEHQVCVNWVPSNTYTFKKIIPTIQNHFGEDYILFSVDDDILYLPTYIEQMLEFLGTYDVACPVPGYVGNRAVMHSLVFHSDLWECLTSNVISSRVDDAYIGFYLKKYNVRCNFRNDTSIMALTIDECNSSRPNSSFCNGYSKQWVDQANRYSMEALGMGTVSNNLVSRRKKVLQTLQKLHR